MAMTTEDLRGRYPGAQTFAFGDGPDLCDLLISHVRRGRKTATTGATRDYAPEDPLPTPGRRDIVTDWTGVPALVIETLEVRRCAFRNVTEEMALAEGRTLDEWRDDHRRFFARTGGFSEDIEVLWERFALVEDLSHGPG